MSKDSKDVRNRILKASEELFALNGYDATGIAQIAKNSEIPKSLLYYYFNSKEQILEELFSNYLLNVKAEKENIFSSDLPDHEKIRQSMIRGFSLLSNNKNIIRILMTELLKGRVNREALFKVIESILPNSLTDGKPYAESENSTNHMPAFIFFFGLAPVIAYMMFGDTWIKNKQLDESVFIEQFLSMAAAAFSNDITGVTPAFFDQQKDVLLGNLKKLL